MDRPGTCIILDKKYNIANSSCHFGSPYDPQCHELFAIYIHKQMVNQGKRTNVLTSNMDSQKVLQRESLIGCIESMCAIS